MAQGEDDSELYWYHPEQRGILPLDDGFHLSRSNKRLFQNHEYTLTLNKDFRGVMEQCRRNREGVWISNRIIDLYGELFELGFAQSVECWKDGALMGGIYGIALGGVFCGESMFSRESGASKIALITLQQALRKAGYVLFDVQYVNEHLTQFGVQEIPRARYLERLEQALTLRTHKLDISAR